MTLLNVFPYDPAIDSVLEHRHLVLAYVLVLIVQIAYLCYLMRQWKITGKAAPSTPREATREGVGPDRVRFFGEHPVLHPPASRNGPPPPAAEEFDGFFSDLSC